jgi:putative transposase
MLLMCISNRDAMVLLQSVSLKRILKRHGGEPRNIVTDKLRSYGVTHREFIPDFIHNISQYTNDRAEQSQSLPRFMGMKRQG